MIREGALQFKVELDDPALEEFSIYARELLLWNRKINLTAITSPEEMAEKHFIDSLAIGTYFKSDANILDIGTGAGFPGIPLKVAFTDLNMTLIDASVKKISFIKHIIRVIGLKAVQAYHVRAENFAEKLSVTARYDAVLARAFASLSTFLDLALPFLSKGGAALALKGSFPLDEVQSLGGSEKYLQHIRWRDIQLEMQVFSYHLPYSYSQRSLIRFIVL